MHILMAASEMTPFAQTGGLGDVLSALPKALSELGVKVSVIIPFYREVKKGNHDFRAYGKPRTLTIAGRRKRYRLLKAVMGRVEVYFVDKPTYFDRGEIYGTTDSDYPDNAERFIFFSLAAADLASRMRPRPEVVHCHDWQTGLVPVCMHKASGHGSAGRLKKTASVFTIHNIGYQGIFPEQAMELTGLDRSVFSSDGLEFYGRLNLLKGGIVFADAVTTVSSRYAEEIQTTEEYGFGLEGVVRDRKDKLTGILNGVDYVRWNPESDPHLPSNYSRGNPGGKAECKRALQARLNLPVRDNVPVIGMVGRLVEQKGTELVVEGIDGLLAPGCQIVVLGVGSSSLQDALQKIARARPEAFACRIGYDNPLSHLIEAGSDLFLMPSRYEPCGLNQIYSLKYGTIPIVRTTGGLDDTVIDVREHPAAGNGFKFSEYTGAAMVETVEQAVEYYRGPENRWKKLMANAFAADFSWSSSARQYLELYTRACGMNTGNIF